MSGPARWLLLLSLAFLGRVLGQALVAFAHVRWLPPMEAWMSGLLAYPLLLPAQLLVLAILAKLCGDHVRGAGWAIDPPRVFGAWAKGIGTVYAAAMLMRYGLRMALHPEARWFGGCIPIAFHFVLAGVFFVTGSAHRNRGA